jgi:hypothetical protein
VKENWTTCVIIASRNGVGSRENDSRDQDSNSRARLRGLLYPLLGLLEKVRVIRFEELVCSLIVIVTVHDIMRGHYLSHTLHGEIEKE